MLCSFPLHHGIITIGKAESVSSLFGSVTGALQIQNAGNAGSLVVEWQGILTVRIHGVFWRSWAVPTASMLMELLVVGLAMKISPHCSWAPWKTARKGFFLHVHVEMCTHSVFFLKGIWIQLHIELWQHLLLRAGLYKYTLALGKGGVAGTGRGPPVMLFAPWSCSLSPPGKRQPHVCMFSVTCVYHIEVPWMLWLQSLCCASWTPAPQQQGEDKVFISPGKWDLLSDYS